MRRIEPPHLTAEDLARIPSPPPPPPPPPIMQQQWTQAGRDQENALIAAYVARGYSVTDAQHLAAQQAQPAAIHDAMGTILFWIIGGLTAMGIGIILLGFILELVDPNGGY